MLCQARAVETSRYLFEECTYVVAVKAELMQWANIHLPSEDFKYTLERIKRKHRKRFQKEVVVALC